MSLENPFNSTPIESSPLETTKEPLVDIEPQKPDLAHSVWDSMLGCGKCGQYGHNTEECTNQPPSENL